MGFMKEAPVNLEVDVMEGDGFVQDYDGKVVQRRGKKDRQIGLHAVGRWFDHVPIEMPIKNIDLPTFTRYCEGCGLTVKAVKPEPEDGVFMDCLVDGCDCHCKKPAVETIKPPEWAVVNGIGQIYLCDSFNRAEHDAKVLIQPVRVVRIDWGAK